MTRKILISAMSAFLILSGCNAPQSTVPSNNQPDTQQKVSEENRDMLPKGTLHKTAAGYEGEVFVRGYAEKTMMDEPFCDQNCDQVEYVFFHIVDQNNEALEEFIEDSRENAYINANQIGLGCLENDHLVRRAFEVNGQRGNAEDTVDEVTTEQILASTENEPVILKLEKTQEVGSEAPACYSHFTNYEIVKL